MKRKSDLLWIAAAAFILLAWFVASAVYKNIGEKPPPPGTISGVTDLKYLIWERFSPIHYCDPDFYPIPRAEEIDLAQEAFPAISQNADEFSSILRHLNMPAKSNFSSEEKLLIYQEHKKLNRAFTFEPSGDQYKFSLISGIVGDEKVWRIEGIINPGGSIRILKREQQFGVACPICLAEEILIDTPAGAFAVKDIRVGMVVWSADASGSRQPALVLKVSRMRVPEGHQVVMLSLDDGRDLFASPGHPMADGRFLGDLRLGDVVDGSRVRSVELVPYGAEYTYDILPSGDTGLYWANDILIQNTLK